MLCRCEQFFGALDASTASSTEPAIDEEEFCPGLLFSRTHLTGCASCFAIGGFLAALSLPPPPSLCLSRANKAKDNEIAANLFALAAFIRKFTSPRGISSAAARTTRPAVKVRDIELASALQSVARSRPRLVHELLINTLFIIRAFRERGQRLTIKDWTRVFGWQIFLQTIATRSSTDLASRSGKLVRRMS